LLRKKDSPIMDWVKVSDQNIHFAIVCRGMNDLTNVARVSFILRLHDAYHTIKAANSIK
jgi:hypothetical protein